MYQSSCFFEYSLLGQGGSTGDGEEDVCSFSLIADSNEALLVGSALAFEGPSGAEECLDVMSGLILGTSMGLEDVGGGMADRDLVKGSMGGSGTPNTVW